MATLLADAAIYTRTPDTDPDLVTAVAVVTAFVDDDCPDAARVTDPATGKVTWAATTQHGAVMLVARLLRRRNSPAGTEALGADGGVSYVARYDPDISRLLRIEAFAPPKVG